MCSASPNHRTLSNVTRSIHASKGGRITSPQGMRTPAVHRGAEGGTIPFPANHTPKPAVTSTPVPLREGSGLSFSCGLGPSSSGSVPAALGMASGGGQCGYSGRKLLADVLSFRLLNWQAFDVHLVAAIDLDRVKRRACRPCRPLDAAFSRVTEHGVHDPTTPEPIYTRNSITPHRRTLP
jgi:hypothetical protein